MIRCLEERLLNVENTVSIEHGHEVKRHVFQQVDVVLVLVKHSMKELVNNVEWHLNGDSFSCVMSSCEKDSRSLLDGLGTTLEPDKGNISAFISLTEA